MNVCVAVRVAFKARARTGTVLTSGVPRPCRACRVAGSRDAMPAVRSEAVSVLLRVLRRRPEDAVVHDLDGGPAWRRGSGQGAGARGASPSAAHEVIALDAELGSLGFPMQLEPVHVSRVLFSATPLVENTDGAAVHTRSKGCHGPFKGDPQTPFCLTARERRRELESRRR